MTQLELEQGDGGEYSEADLKDARKMQEAKHAARLERLAALEVASLLRPCPT